VIRKQRAERDRTLESSQDAANRMANVNKLLGDLEADLNGLVYGFGVLTKDAEGFKPTPRPYMSTFDPSVDDSDPREDLHVLRGRLRFVAKNLKGARLIICELEERYSGLLNQ
jgi:hypothetical protein